MSDDVNLTLAIQGARARLSQFVDRAAKGEVFIITKAGKPLVKMTAVDAPNAPQRLDFLAGEIAVPRDFNRRARPRSRPCSRVSQGAGDRRRAQRDVRLTSYWPRVPAQRDAVDCSLHVRMPNMVDLVQSNREEILGLAERRGVTRVRVFGSMARGDAGPQSDVDLLIEVGENPSAWFPGGFVAELEQLLDRRVQVVTEGALDELIRDRVLKEAVPL